MPQIMTTLALAEPRKTVLKTRKNADGTSSTYYEPSPENRQEHQRILMSFPVRAQVAALILYHDGKKPMFLPSTTGNGNIGKVMDFKDMTAEEYNRSQRRCITNAKQHSRIDLVELLIKKDREDKRKAAKAEIRKLERLRLKQVRTGKVVGDKISLPMIDQLKELLDEM